MQRTLPANHTPIIFSTYRVFLRQLDTQQISLTIINADFTKRYHLETNQSLFEKINYSTLRSGFLNDNKYIKLGLKEEEKHIEVRLDVRFPLLPEIVEVIKCPLEKQIGQEESNMLRLEEVKSKCLETKEMCQKTTLKYSDDNNIFCFTKLAQEPAYDQYGNYETSNAEGYDATQGTIKLGQLPLKPGTRYLVTLSFFANSVQTFTCYYGDYITTKEVFSNSGTPIYENIQDSKDLYKTYHLREYFTPNSSQGDSFFYAFDSGVSGKYKNILITAQKME